MNLLLFLIMSCIFSSDVQLLEKPTKCITQRKIVEINCQIQRIDFEGRSDGESMLKILSQLRPRRVIVVHGNQEATKLVAKHCHQNIGARVFTPQKGEVRNTQCFFFFLL